MWKIAQYRTARGRNLQNIIWARLIIKSQFTVQQVAILQFA